MHITAERHTRQDGGVTKGGTLSWASGTLQPSRAFLALNRPGDGEQPQTSVQWKAAVRSSGAGLAERNDERAVTRRYMTLEALAQVQVSRVDSGSVDDKRVRSSIPSPD